MFTLETILLYIRLTLGITDPTAMQQEEARMHMDRDVKGTSSYFQNSGYSDSDGDGSYTYAGNTSSSNTSGGWDIYEGN